MKWKILSVLLLAMLILIAIRHRLITYLVEETLVVVSFAALAMIALLFLQILMLFARRGLQCALRWFAGKFCGTNKVARNRLTQTKPLRSLPLGSDLSKHRVAESDLGPPKGPSRLFRRLR